MRKIKPLTCTDCKNYKFCLESDRQYVCKDFKKKENKYAYLRRND